MRILFFKRYVRMLIHSVLAYAYPRAMLAAARFSCILVTPECLSCLKQVVMSPTSIKALISFADIFMQNVIIHYILVWKLLSLLIYVERRNFLHHVATKHCQNSSTDLRMFRHEFLTTKYVCASRHGMLALRFHGGQFFI